IGCFIYSYLGIGSAVVQLNAIIENQPTLASGPIMIGFAVAFGIISCVSFAGTVSAGHYNPAITIAHTLYRKFPPWKAPFYIFVHIFGGYLACGAVYFQSRFTFLHAEEVLRQKGVLDQLQFTTQGPSAVFAFYVPPGQTLWGSFINEFLASLAASSVYWAVMDPSNTLVTPRMSVWIAAFAYGVSIWSFGAILNTSRDLGGRLWAITVWGQGANAGTYAWISSLTNIAGMIIAVFFYELFMIDSRRVVNLESLEHHRLMTKRLTNIDMRLRKEHQMHEVESKSSSNTASMSQVNEKPNRDM
ncbi:hypothetical protein AN958_06304, partial [Leucoagaricus sp. SymC.cos]